MRKKTFRGILWSFAKWLEVLGKEIKKEKLEFPRISLCDVIGNLRKSRKFREKSFPLNYFKFPPSLTSIWNVFAVNTKWYEIPDSFTTNSIVNICRVAQDIIHREKSRIAITTEMELDIVENTEAPWGFLKNEHKGSSASETFGLVWRIQIRDITREGRHAGIHDARSKVQRQRRQIGQNEKQEQSHRNLLSW